MSLREIPNALSLIILMCACRGYATMAGADGAPATVIGDVTVISPERVQPLEHAHVIIEKGRIAEISRKSLAANMEIYGHGKFLIPGLFDTHTHVRQVPGTLAPQRSADPDVASADAQEPRRYLYFGFTTVLSLGDTSPPVKFWNARAVSPDAYFCGGTRLANGYSFQDFTDNPYFLFKTDQDNALPSLIDRTQHTPGAVVERTARDGAIHPLVETPAEIRP